MEDLFGCNEYTGITVVLYIFSILCFCFSMFPCICVLTYSINGQNIQICKGNIIMSKFGGTIESAYNISCLYQTIITAVSHWSVCIKGKQYDFLHRDKAHSMLHFGGLSRLPACTCPSMSCTQLGCRVPPSEKSWYILMLFLFLPLTFFVHVRQRTNSIVKKKSMEMSVNLKLFRQSENSPRTMRYMKHSFLVQVYCLLR